MGFMEPQTRRMKMWIVETTHGTEKVPAEFVGLRPERASLQPYCRGGILPRCPINQEQGWYCRESAPGYIDCTDWEGPYRSEQAAIEGYCELHGICPECFDQCWETDHPCRPETS